MTYNFASNFQTYDIYDMDLDGFSTMSKTLSVLADMTGSTPKTLLYAYLLGPYKFAGSRPYTITSGSGGPPITISGTYTV